MVIRMKGKHIVYAGVALLMIILIVANFGGYLLYQYAVVLDKLGYTEKANVYYSRISDYYSGSNSGVLAEYKRIQNILLKGNFNYSTSFTVITSASISNPGYVGYKTVDSVNMQFEKLKDNRRVNRRVMEEYTISVALVNWFGGKSDRAVDMLKVFIAEEQRLEELRKLHLSNMYFYLGETEKCMQVIEQMKPLKELIRYQEDILVLNQLFRDGGEVTYKNPMIYEYNPSADCLEEPLKFARSLIDSLQIFIVNSQANLNDNQIIEKNEYAQREHKEEWKEYGEELKSAGEITNLHGQESAGEITSLYAQESAEEIAGIYKQKGFVGDINIEGQKSIQEEESIKKKDTVGKERIVDVESYIKTGENVLSGRIMMDGKPQQNLMVFIQNAEYKNSWSSPVGAHFGLTGLGISDEEGYFEIVNIPDGVYGMVMYAPWQRITGKNIIMHTEFDMALSGGARRTENITLSNPIRLTAQQNGNTVTFQWNDDEIPESQYLLAISELKDSDGMLFKSNNTYYQRGISGNEVSVDIADAQKKAYRLGISYSGEPDPWEYLEPLYHTGQYGYSLSSTQWDRMLSFTSEGIYPNRPPAWISIQGSEWTPEDRLLLDGKIEEARIAYEQLLQNEPENIHALKVLSRMYSHGYIASEEENFLYNLGGRDETRALVLLQRLDDVVDSTDIKNALAAQYRELKEYRKAVALYKIIQTRTFTPYIELEIGRLHMYMNEYPEAVTCFQRYTQETGVGTLNLFVPAILMNDMDLLMEGANQYKTLIYTDIRDLVTGYIQMDKTGHQDFFAMVKQGRIDEAQEWLNGRDGEIDGFLKAVLLLTRDSYGISYEERDKAFRECHQQVQDPVLDELLIYFGREFINSGYRTPMDY